MLTPQNILGPRINQLDIQSQILSALDEAPVQDRLHIEFRANLSRLDRFTFIAKHAAARLHVQVRQLRQTADERFRHTVGKVFRVGISAHINKWQDRH